MNVFGAFKKFVLSDLPTRIDFMAMLATKEEISVVCIHG